MKKVAILLILSLVWSTTSAQETLYDIGTIQKIELFFSQPDWNHQLHVLKITTDGYLKCDSAKINGLRFPNSGVKYKGNSSYDSNWVKNPLHISLNKFQSQDYQGFNDIKLSNCYQDPSMIREVLSYKILSNYMECPRANFAQVYVNGQYFGLYSNIEDVGKTFCANRFKSTKTNTFIKANPIITPGPTVKSNLKYLGSDSSAYSNYYELKSATGWNQLVALCEVVTNHPETLPTVMDIDRVIWMLAFDNVLVNLDSYMGAFAQNYYLFKDNNGFFNPIVWDLNMSFGGFPFAGSSNTSLGTLGVANIKQFPISIHQTDPYWPVINAIQANERFKKMYHAHVRTLVNEIFVTSAYDTMAVQMQSLIDTAVATDTNKFFTTNLFHTSMVTDISGGNYQIPGIRTMMTARTAYLQARPEISANPPSITGVVGSYSTTFGEATVTALLGNHSDTAVYLGHRLSASKKFIRIRMWDDGLHNDGAAGDQVFGASFAADPAQSQFYIYAENPSASTFSPARAEFEFYSLSTFAGNSSVMFGPVALSVYPNPSEGKLAIHFNKNSPQILEILDPVGRLALKVRVEDGQEIQLTHLPDGMYWLRLGAEVKKWVLRR